MFVSGIADCETAKSIAVQIALTTSYRMETIYFLSLVQVYEYMDLCTDTSFARSKQTRLLTRVSTSTKEGAVLFYDTNMPDVIARELVESGDR